MATTDDLTAISGKDVMTKTKLDPKVQAWITARWRHQLSHAHWPTARKLGMSPAKIGMLDDVPRLLMPRDDSEATR